MAAAGFRFRRVSADVALGDRLKRARVRKKLSVAQVEAETRIRGKFLLALESDSWDQIPSEVYGRGYLERYVTFLGMNTSEVMAEYERARHRYARTCKEQEVAFAPTGNVRLPKLVVTARSIGVGSMLLITGLGISFVGRQLAAYAAAPPLQLTGSLQGTYSEVNAPAGDFVVSGTVPTGATVRVNGEPAQVVETQFSRSIVVQPGVNAVVVEATSPGGKTTTEIRSVVVVPPTGETDNNTLD